MNTDRSGATPPRVDAGLEAWLGYIELQHSKPVDMGLDRVRIVADRMRIRLECPIITVGGTNGKGSTCAMLEAILSTAGYRVGCYTSPHLLRYNERVRIDRKEASDRAICEGLAAVDAVRGDTSLTYFEFGTLAAADYFSRSNIDVAVLEVGLGGRLDAVNIFDTECAVITSIGVDHVEYLGPTRESIAREKAGIFRAGRPAVIAEPDVPHTMLDYAREIGANIWRYGVDFNVESEGVQWRYNGPGGRRSGLPHPALRGPYQLFNAAAAITAIDTLRGRLPVSAGALRQGLLSADVPGRFQVLPGRPAVVLDVAHNPHAAERLASALAAMQTGGKTFAVFAMLKDKDIEGVVRAVKQHIDHWFIAPLEGPRGADTDRIKHALDTVHVLDEITECDSVSSAIDQIHAHAHMDDRILIFGSFLTVAQAMKHFQNATRGAMHRD